jgi:hypothetical protein
MDMTKFLPKTKNQRVKFSRIWKRLEPRIKKEIADLTPEEQKGEIFLRKMLVLSQMKRGRTAQRTRLKLFNHWLEYAEIPTTTEQTINAKERRAYINETERIRQDLERIDEPEPLQETAKIERHNN